MNRPVILCGLGRMGGRVLEYLLAAGMAVVVIDNVCQPGDPRLLGCRLVRGDCRRRELLVEAGVADASGVLVLTNEDLLNVSTALMVRGLNPDVRIVLRMFNQNLLARLGKAVRGVYALSTSMLTAPILALTALTGQALGGFRLTDSPDGRRQLAEIVVGPTSLLRAQTVGNLMAERDLVVVAHHAADEDRLLLDVDPGRRIDVGDRLVVSGPPSRLRPLLADREAAPGVRMGGFVRRNLRMLWRTLAELDLPVAVCTAVLVVVVAISTLILKFGVTRYSLPDALLRSVSIIATGAGLSEADYPDSPYIRVYASVLRIVGAVLMAAFTAIVTNYLLRARLGGVLEVRRVPEGGHVVICGLSTVGFRVVEELIRMGERVVVIELKPDNRFIATARRLGAAVMIGDATVVEVLKQAHAAEARAVVPATNNDMTNLEVALLARDLTAGQHVVVLINDPLFAQMLRDAAGIRLAVSVPALAAPAFVAGLYGDRVLSVLLLKGERLMAVLDLVINEGDLLADHVVRAVAVDYRLLPLGLVRRGAALPGGVMNARLEAGDRLVGVIALTDLERLLRRSPASAAWAVDVRACPLPQRAWLAGLLRVTAGLTAEDAERALDALPFRLAGGLTRGQAEDLLAQLQRERVTATVAEEAMG